MSDELNLKQPPSGGQGGDNLEDWFKCNLHEYAQDIAENGADCGFPSLIYTYEMVEIFNHFEEEIWTIVNDYAEEMGDPLQGAGGALSLISKFNRIDMACTFDGLKALIIWFIAEQFSQKYQDIPYQEDDEEEFDYVEFEDE